jgi:hypothetical protein
VTVGLEMGGADALRPFVDLAHPQHPSLLDQTHRMDALFGVTNIPQNIWIDETGTIVRPPEPGSPAPVYVESDDPTYKLVMQYMHERRDNAAWYSDRIREWARRGAASEWAMTPEQVVAASRPRSEDVSRAAAHFDLAQHRWRTEGFTDGVLAHLEQAHTLQPDNITYRRQAYSAWSRGDRSDPASFFLQTPKPGEEADWPFVSDFGKDMKTLGITV